MACELVLSPLTPLYIALEMPMDDASLYVPVMESCCRFRAYPDEWDKRLLQVIFM
jgi:hypothetical protein